jgi:hypothetical protein
VIATTLFGWIVIVSTPPWGRAVACGSITGAADCTLSTVAL